MTASVVGVLPMSAPWLRYRGRAIVLMALIPLLAVAVRVRMVWLMLPLGPWSKSSCWSHLRKVVRLPLARRVTRCRHDYRAPLACRSEC